MAERRELLEFFQKKEPGWQASKLDLQDFTLILDKNPASASAGDEDSRTPLHQLAARAGNATEWHVQMFALLLQRVPECAAQKDSRGLLPRKLIQDAASKRPSEFNLKMLDMVLRADKSGLAIGIDIGITHCCAAIFHHNKAEVIPDADGRQTTPNWVAYEGRNVHVGERAKVHATKDSQNSIFAISRLAGKKFQDPAVQRDIPELPYKVVNRLGGRPHVVVKYDHVIKEMIPEQLLALVLQRTKETAEKHLGNDVEHCVLTVPAHYDDQQRKAIREAALLSGLNVLRIINEPTAAAMAYGLEKGERGSILVYDLGGGSFDVTLMNIEDGTYEVKGMSGDTHLGGNSFDRKLALYCIDEMKRKHNLSKNLAEDPCAMRKILNKCEEAKKRLSKDSVAQIEIDGLADCPDFHIILARKQFEELCGNLFGKTLDSVDRVLRNANMQKSQIQRVVLVGGSTRIPKIQSLVSDFFGESEVEILKNIGADACIASGAAIQAFKIANADTKVEEQIELTVAPLTIGVETAGGVMTRIINKGTELPIDEKVEELCSITAQQPAVLVQVYEGERLFARDNELLGRLLLDNLECGPRGEPVVLKVSYAKNGKITLKVECCRRSATISIPGNKKRFAREEVRKKEHEAQQEKQADMQRRKPIDMRNELENYAHWLNNRPNSQMSVNAKALLDENVRATLDWLKANPKAEYKEIESKKQNLETVELAAGKAWQESEATTGSRVQRID